MTNRKKIVIHCATGIKNTGDEAILDVLLAAYGEKYDVTVISLNPEYSARMHTGARFIANGGSDWKAAIESCDLFILGGGGLIQDKTTIYNVSRWLTKIKYAQKLGKKTYIYANSLEPFQFGINARMTAKVLKMADAITLRDPISVKIAKKLGAENVHLTADPVYGYPLDKLPTEESHTEESSPAKSPIEGSAMTMERSAACSSIDLPDKYIVMTVRHWYDTHPLIPVSVCNKLGIRNKKNQSKYEAYIRKLVLLAEGLHKQYGLPIVWLSCFYGRDDKVAKDVIEQSRRRHAKADSSVNVDSWNRIVEGEFMTPSQAMDVIGGAQLLIGMRLHSFIYAFLMKTPVLMLSYQEKVRGMAQLAGIEDDCVDVDTFGVDDLLSKAGELLEEPGRQTKVTALFAEKMREIQKVNEKLALELLDENGK